MLGVEDGKPYQPKDEASADVKTHESDAVRAVGVNPDAINFKVRKSTVMVQEDSSSCDEDFIWCPELPGDKQADKQDAELK